MPQISNRNPLVICILIICFTLQVTSISSVEGQVDSILEVQQRLAGISEEERQVVQELFVLLQEIESIEVEERKINKEIEVINKEIGSLEKNILKETIDYSKMQENLKQVLRSYQRMGASSYFKIILESDSITGLIRRINTIRDIASNTTKLLNELDNSKGKLEIEKSNLTDKLISMEEKQTQLNDSLQKKLEAKEKIEKYLGSLEEDREYYEEYLKNIQLVWNDLKTTFSEASKEFSRVIKEENISPDTLNISFTLLGIKGTIDELGFNNIIKDHSKLPEMEFHFYPGKIEMTLPENGLTLSGTFIITENNLLKFEVMEGKFFGMPLESNSIEELFNQGYMILDFKPLIGDNKLRSIQITEGYIELLIVPVLR